MDAYLVGAASASSLELRVECYVVEDGGGIRDYRGPQLFVIAHGGRLGTIDELSRQVEELAPERMLALIELAFAACAEAAPDTGADTALARPMTFYHLRAHRSLGAQDVHQTIAINHHAPAALGPAMTRCLAALREASGRVPETAVMGWDLAATWMGPSDLGDVFAAGGSVSLAHIVQTFAQDGVVYFRAGQPPQRTERYRLDGHGLVWLRDGGEELVPAIDRHRWVLPCGAGVIETHYEWDQPRRIYVRITDPVRGIYVQRA